MPEQYSKLVFSIVLILIGLQVGSFANVCIYRWPRSLTVLKPVRSFCPWCQTQIPWYDNIPVLSFVILGARGRCCGSSISFRYPIVEVMVPLSWVFLFLSGALPSAQNIPFIAASFIFAFVLIVTILTDLEWKIIPDQAAIAFIIVALATAPWNPLLNINNAQPPFLQALAGLSVGAGMPVLVAAVGRLIMGKEVLGWGDIKLLAGFGAFLGWQGAVAVLFVGSVLGAVASLLAISFKLIKRHHYIPFAPFLNVSAYGVLIYFLKHLDISMLPK